MRAGCSGVLITRCRAEPCTGYHGRTGSASRKNRRRSLDDDAGGRSGHDRDAAARAAAPVRCRAPSGRTVAAAAHRVHAPARRAAPVRRRRAREPRSVPVRAAAAVRRARRVPSSGTQQIPLPVNPRLVPVPAAPAHQPSSRVRARLARLGGRAARTEPGARTAVPDRPRLRPEGRPAAARARLRGRREVAPRPEAQERRPVHHPPAGGGDDPRRARHGRRRR